MVSPYKVLFPCESRRKGDDCMYPLISAWNIYQDPDKREQSEKDIKQYAAELIRFMDSAKVGDKLTLIPAHAKEAAYSYSIIGRVYGREGFEAGDSIATSVVYGFTRVVDDGNFGTTFAVQTKNTLYHVHANEARQLLCIKAGIR